MPKQSAKEIPEFCNIKIDENHSFSCRQWLHLGPLEEIVLYDKSDLTQIRESTTMLGCENKRIRGIT